MNLLLKFLALILSINLLLSTSIFAAEYKRVLGEVALVSVPPAMMMYLFCKIDGEKTSTSIKASLITMVFLGAGYYAVKRFFRDFGKEEKADNSSFGFKRKVIPRDTCNGSIFNYIRYAR